MGSTSCNVDFSDDPPGAWLHLVIDCERELRGYLDDLVAARRALSRSGLVALQEFLCERAPAALDAVDALLTLDDAVLQRVLEERSSAGSAPGWVSEAAR